MKRSVQDQLKELDAKWEIRVDRWDKSSRTIIQRLAIRNEDGENSVFPMTLFLGKGILDFDNIKFTKPDGLTTFKLKKWIESKDVMWVEFAIPPKFVGVLFYIYYNKEET